MFNTEKKSVQGYNKYSSNNFEDVIPLFIPDNVGPWAVRYIWVKNHDVEFLQNYYSISDKGAKSNIRKSSVHLKEHWIPHNCLMINQGHLGNIVWRIKTANPFNNSVDIIEVWRSREIIESLFNFDNEEIKQIEFATILNPEVSPAKVDLSQGGTGLKNGSGLTINDPDAPTFYKKENSEMLAKGLADLGFDIRSWDSCPLISKTQAIKIYRELENRSKTTDKININTGWNPELNSI
jgi:hypothetical protein